GLIANEHPNVTLLLAGTPVFDHDGYERRLRALATEFALEDRIKFAGYRHDLPQVLAAMDVFAFTSIEKDTSPLVLLSAMSSGLPIVAFDIDGVKELVHGDECMLQITLRDVEALAQALSTLICDRKRRLRLGECARRAAESRFNLQEH